MINPINPPTNDLPAPGQLSKDMQEISVTINSFLLNLMVHWKTHFAIPNKNEISSA
jgi:hypothetical protein